MSKDQNIFLIGPMGAGKSTIGRLLATSLNKTFLDSDKEIENYTGANLQLIFDLEGEQGFRIRESKIINELTQKTNIVLATGGGVILTPINLTYLSSRGIIIYLMTNINQQLSRTIKRKSRPLLINNHTKQDHFLHLTELAKQRNHLYKKIADFTVSTNDSKINNIVTNIIDLLVNKYNYST